MKQVISSKHLSTIIFLLSIMVGVKLLWLIISMLFLPTTGEELKQSAQAKKLYYRVRLSNPSKVNITSPKAPTKSVVTSMKGYKLLGLYHSDKKLVVTVSKGSKTSILSGGEKINGFELFTAGDDYVLFRKNGQEFKLSLENRKNSKTHMASSHASKTPTSPSAKTSKIVEEGGTKHIPKNLLVSYTKDIDKVWKDVGLSNYKKDGKSAGFKVNFVKKGSDIEALGLERGDILTAINAEPLNLSSAMNFFNGINDLDNLTLTVERNGISKDLEYEIQ